MAATASLRTKALSSAKGKAKIAEVRKKFKDGKLKMGKSGKKVTSPKQAEAIALSEAQWEGFKKRHGSDNNAQAQSQYKKLTKKGNLSKATRKAAVSAGAASVAIEEKKKKRKKKQ